jgi:hypothetical protein
MIVDRPLEVVVLLEMMLKGQEDKILSSATSSLS